MFIILYVIKKKKSWLFCNFTWHQITCVLKLAREGCKIKRECSESVKLIIVNLWIIWCSIFYASGQKFVPIFNFHKIQNIEQFAPMKSIANEQSEFTLLYISNFERKSKGCPFWPFFRFPFLFLFSLSLFFHFYWIEIKSVQ